MRKFSSAKKAAVLTAIAALATAGLAACTDGGKTAGPVEIQYLHRLPDGEGMTKVADIVAKWNKEHPNIQVKATKFDGKADEMAKKLETDVKAKNAPCLAQLGYAELPSAFTKGLVEDVTAEAAKYKDKFSAGTMSLVTIGGKSVGLPQDNGPLVYYYNKAEFDKLGISVPKTWDEFTAAAQKAAGAGKFIADFEPDEALNWLSGQAVAEGAKWYAAEGDKWKVSVDDEATKALAGHWQNLLDKKLVLTEKRWDDGFKKALTEQKLIGTVGAAWEASLLAGDPKDGGMKGTANDGKWAVAPLPTKSGKPGSGPDGGSAVAVMKGCAHPAEAMEFNAWFNTQIDDLVTQGLVVAAKGEMKTPEGVKTFFGGQDVMGELAKANEAMGEFTYIPTFGAIGKPMGEVASNAATGSAKVIDIFTTAQKESVKSLKDAGLPVVE